MKWLITGGCGFVGTNLVDKLLSAGCDVSVLDNLQRGGSRENLRWLLARHGAYWRFIHGDVRDSDVLGRAIEDLRPDVIAHLAGQVAMTVSMERPREDFEINALGTINVLEAVRLRSPETIVLYSSTNKVYGSLGWLRYEETPTRYILADYPYGIDESFPIEGASPYGCSKLCAEQYCRDYARLYGLRTVVFRHSAMFGARQHATYDQGWIGWFCSKAVEVERGHREPFTICGDGKQVRDVLHADDVVRLYQAAVANIDRAAGNIYNIGGGVGNSLSLLELFAKLELWCGVTLCYRRLPWRLADQKVFVADIRRAERELGWKPTVSADDGLQQMLKWTRERMAA